MRSEGCSAFFFLRKSLKECGIGDSILVRQQGAGIQEN
jgi:hypothetical protein